MNVLPTALYAYVDVDVRQHYIRGALLADSGGWNVLVTYQRYNAVNYGGRLYTALQTVTGTAPLPAPTPKKPDPFWSALAVVGHGTTSAVGAGQIVPYTGVDPNSDGVVPPNPDQQAIAVKPGATTWTWDTENQLWT